MSLGTIRGRDHPASAWRAGPAELSSAVKTVAWVVMASIPIEFGAILVLPDYTTRWAVIIAAVYGLCVPVLLLNRRGHTRGAAFLLVAGLWGIVTACALTAGGTAALAPWFYVVVVLIAGLFFGARAGATTALLAAVTLLAHHDPRDGGRASVECPALHADGAAGSG